jgi:hypothetical protein
MANGKFLKQALRLANRTFRATLFAITSLCAYNAAAQTFGTGTLQGIIWSESNNDEGFGLMTLTVTKTGTFTMRFNVGINSVGHHYYARTGKFDSSGHYHLSGPAPTDTRYEIPVNMDLQLDSIDNPTKVSGELDDYTHSSHIQLERIFTWSRGNMSQNAGVYTFLFNGTHEPDPLGTGYGRAVVSPTGYMTWSGRTPDGKSFVQGAYTTIYNNWPVFTVMAGVRYGIFSGWLNFADQRDTDFSAQLTWIGPEEPGPNHAFVPQFVTSINLDGSRYVPLARGQTVLNLNSSTNNVHLTFTDGGLEGQIDRDLTLTSRNTFLFNPRQRGDSLVVTPAWGYFTGTFQHTDGRIYVYRGAILQKQNRGGGQFVTIDHDSGGVSLTTN